MIATIVTVVMLCAMGAVGFSAWRLNRDAVRQQVDVRDALSEASQLLEDMRSGAAADEVAARQARTAIESIAHERSIDKDASAARPLFSDDAVFRKYGGVPVNSDEYVILSGRDALMGHYADSHLELTMLLAELMRELPAPSESHQRAMLLEIFWANVDRLQSTDGLMLPVDRLPFAWEPRLLIPSNDWPGHSEPIKGRKRDEQAGKIDVEFWKLVDDSAR